MADHNQTLSHRVQSFAPAVGTDPQVLVLGTMPGVASLQAQQYYAHPRNAFWPIMSDVCDFDSALNYSQRLQHIQQRGVAIWDVLASCDRPGSLDSAITRSSAQANVIAQLLQTHASIRAIALNGHAAWQLFKRHVMVDASTSYALLLLPSTSPAHAGMRFADKLAKWRQLQLYLR